MLHLKVRAIVLPQMLILLALLATTLAAQVGIVEDSNTTPAPAFRSPSDPILKKGLVDSAKGSADASATDSSETGDPMSSAGDRKPHLDGNRANEKGDDKGDDDANEKARQGEDDDDLGEHISPAKTLFSWAIAEPKSSDANEDKDDEKVGPIATDRPDFTEASSTVGRGVWQVESGYTYAYDRTLGSQRFGHSYPEILSRYGVWADWLELRAAWNFSAEQANGVRVDGAEDLYLGLKLALTEQAKWLPEMALVPQMTVPSGDTALSADTVLPGLNWLYGWDVNDWLSTAGSTQVNRALEGDSGRSYTEVAQSWTVGYSFTEHIGGYTEWFALIPNGAETSGVEHYANGGLTLKLFDVQWDVRAGMGLNDRAIDYFAGIGLSVRLRPSRSL